MTDEAIERFWSNVEKDGCWLWTRSCNTGGYGQFWLRGEGRFKLAHRVAYELLVGPIPEGMTLDHICRHRSCCNPDHLEPVTLGDNVRRGLAPAGINARKTRCIHGHELAGDNLYVYPGSGRRRCRTCRREWDQRAIERKAA